MITAIVLAAGQSRRMGKPKMLLPWGEITVLERVIQTLQTARLQEILVVTGGARAGVEALVHAPVRAIFNPDYERGEMLSSVQVGLGEANGTAALIVIGDQPQVRIDSLELVLEEFARGKSSIIVPSYNMHRGHPWLVQKRYWSEILEMKSGESLRDFLNRHRDEIRYVNVDDPGVMQDLDTPEDYLKSRP